MSGSTRQDKVIAKLEALKAASPADAAVARAELIKVVFDTDGNQQISTQEADYRRWRGGLGVDARTGKDIRTEVEKALGIQNVRDSKAMQTILTTGLAGSGVEVKAPPLQSETSLKAALDAYRAGNKGSKALLTTFFDGDGNGLINRAEITDGATRLKNWDRMRAGRSDVPSANDVRIIGELSGLLNPDGSASGAAFEQIVKALTDQGLKMADDAIEPPPTNRPAPKSFQPFKGRNR